MGLFLAFIPTQLHLQPGHYRPFVNSPEKSELLKSLYYLSTSTPVIQRLLLFFLPLSSTYTPFHRQLEPEMNENKTRQDKKKTDTDRSGLLQPSHLLSSMSLLINQQFPDSQNSPNSQNSQNSKAPTSHHASLCHACKKTTSMTVTFFLHLGEDTNTDTDTAVNLAI